MADLRDVHGNPIQLTDEHGNPVQLTDEHGNPVHVSGVATPGTHTDQTWMGYDPTAYAAQPQPQLYYEQPQPQAQRLHYEVSTTTREEIQHSNNSSSSEDDGMGGRRRKKKGLTEKIKEKLTGAKHKEAEESETVTYVAKTSVTTTTGNSMSAPEMQQHQKKSVMEKIKEKLPGHHTH